MIAEIHKKRWQLLLRKPTFKEHYYFRLVAPNGEVIAQSETYTQKHNAMEVVAKYFPNAVVKDRTAEKPYNKHI
jgi:uncharacterized protein YegP (UPF0339 family)